jgi:hypothetical protein
MGGPDLLDRIGGSIRANYGLQFLATLACKEPGKGVTHRLGSRDSGPRFLDLLHHQNHRQDGDSHRQPTIRAAGG